MPTPTPRRRPWYRWRWLPLLVALLSVGGGWLVFRWKEARDQPAYLRGANGDGNDSHYGPGATTLESPNITPDRLREVQDAFRLPLKEPPP